MKSHLISRAFTLIELLVVIAIIAILAAILFPVFAQAKQAAKRSVTISYLKQNALAVTMYANDTDDVVPLTWQDYPNNLFIIQKLYPYTKSIDLAWDASSPIPNFVGGRTMTSTNAAGSWGNWTAKGTLGWSNAGMEVPKEGARPRVMSSQEHPAELMIAASCDMATNNQGCFAFTETQPSCYEPVETTPGARGDANSPGRAAFRWHNKGLPSAIMDGHAYLAKGMFYVDNTPGDCYTQASQWYSGKSSVGDYTPNNAWSTHYLTPRVLNFWGTWWDGNN